jgi:hypothetical protein
MSVRAEVNTLSRRHDCTERSKRTRTWPNTLGIEISPCVASLSSTHLTLVAKLFAAPPACTLLRAFHISNFTTSPCHYSIPSLAQDVHISTRRFEANGTCALFATSTMSAFESAIDDSFDPAPQLVRDTEGRDDDLFDNAYQGPREGHWEVTSSIGSFIDDRCPTTYDYGHRSCTNGRGALIDEGLAKKLMQATIEEKRVTALTKDKTPTSLTSHRAKQSSTPLEVKSPKPFFVPALRNRSYDPVMPDVAAVANDTTASPKANSAKVYSKSNGNAESPAAASHHTLPPAVAGTSAASDNPGPSPSTGRTINILGKNGEVAFVNLPSLPKTYPRASSSFTPDAADKLDSRSEPHSRDHKQTHSPSPRSGISVKGSIIPAVSDRIGERRAQMEHDQWATTSPANGNLRPTSSPVMSGALSATSWKSASAARSNGQSCKDSGVAMGGMSAVVSKAGSGKTVSTKPGSAISQGVFSFAQRVANTPSAPSKRPEAVQAAPVQQPFEEIGMGVTTGFPAQKQASERSNRTAAHQSFRSQRESQRTVGSNVTSTEAARQSVGSQKDSQHIVSSNMHSSQPAQEYSRQVSTQSNYKPPTVHSVSSSSSSRQASTHAHHKPPMARSASSSSSITHTFGGFHQDGFVQQANTQLAPHNYGQGSVDKCQSRSGSHGDKKSASSNVSVCDRVSPVCPSHSPISPFASSPHLVPATEPQTNFAGDGWISPHPLSVASTDVGAAPQPAVHLSADSLGHRATLTYDEWRAQRDAAGSVAGSFAGSRVPSAVELQTVPPAVYNYPPPADYAGSYHQKTVQPLRARSHAGHHLRRDSEHDHWISGTDVAGHTALVHDRRLSFSAHASVHSHVRSLSTRHKNAAYNGSAQRSPSVRSQAAGRDLPAQHDGSAPNSGRMQEEGYTVGLTPSELANYQNQLSSTISRYSSQLSQVQQDQAPPHPDYDVWNSAQSHTSGHAASQRSTSAHAFPSNLSYPRETTQLAMPWDRASSHAGTPTALSSHARSQRVGLARGSHKTSSDHGHGSVHLVPLLDGNNSQVSVVSQSRIDVPQSQVTYGDAEWQDLENAEDGHGKFQSRQDYRMW